jgi:protein-S-isoprenylcysteine O-methyltransferase Ste14
MEFLLGMALFLDSFVALGLLLVQVTWLAKNVAIDENRLLERYGEKYEEYKNLVPRWIPRLGRGPQRLGASTKGQEA